MLKHLSGLTRWPRRLATYALCTLPAFGFGLHVPQSSFVATYLPACGGTGVAPSVRTKFASAAHPAPKQCLPVARPS